MKAYYRGKSFIYVNINSVWKSKIKDFNKKLKIDKQKARRKTLLF